MAKIFGRVVSQGPSDVAGCIGIEVVWNAIGDDGGSLGGNTDAVPVPMNLTDTEMVAAARQALADCVNTKGLPVTFAATDVYGVQL